jgi:S-adenosylmethionine decarboxylase
MRFSPFGHEWIVDAHGCDKRALRSRATLESLFTEIIEAIGLRAVGSGTWHTFDGEAGVTGLQMLSESHLACHTYPEAGYAAFSLYCCRADPVDWPWSHRLTGVLGASGVSVRVVRRGPIGSMEEE